MCFRIRNPFTTKTNANQKTNEKELKPPKIMSYGLKFFEENLEASYKSDLSGYQKNYLRFFIISVGLLSWVSNPIAIKKLDAYGILFNVLNITIFIILSVLVFLKKKKNHVEIILFVIQTVECIGFIEVARKTEVNLRTYNYILLTIFLELVMLVPMISRCHWKFNAVSALLINIYANIRYLHSQDSQEEVVISSSALYFLNFMIITIGSYLSEKYDRNLYYINKSNEKSLKNLEFIIREIFPTSIIIYNKGKIAFHNKETLNLLEITSEERIEDRLFSIKVKDDSTIKETFSPGRKANSLISKNQGLDFLTKNENNINTGQNEDVNPLLNRDLDLNKILFERNAISDFKKYAGALPNEKNLEQKKLLEIKIGKIIWERDDALLCILTEDLASQRISYLKEQAIYKDHLLATVSHDLRTPLNGIIGILELSLSLITDENLRKNLSLALRSSKLLLYMINDILDFSQIGMGKLSLNPIDFCISETVKEVAKLIKFQAKIKGIDFIFCNRFPLNKRLVIHNDPNRLKQVVLNLLSNALKFTQTGLIKLTIEPNECTEESTQNVSINKGCRISVEDTGSGIKNEDLPKLFHLFGKLESYQNRKVNPNGVGLGLAISQQLVSYLNKSSPDKKGITVMSEVGKGSTFSFVIFPMKEECIQNKSASSESDYIEEDFSEYEANHAARNKLPVSSISKFQNLSFGRKHVLLVDDDQINIKVLKTYFKNFQDCEYDVAFNGSAAISLVKEKAKENYFYDIIFMDCNMPVLDGFDATKIILELVEQQVIPSLPIVASTANVSKTDLERCTSAGMADFISKPFSQAEVRKKLNKWIGE